MNLIDIGSMPISFAATASIATWSAAREDHVLRVRDHAARPGAVAGERAVHHREHAAVDLLLDHQQVHERLVDDRVRPVPVLVQQPAERVLHRAGRRREDVRLHGRQVDDVLADEPPRDHEPVRVDLVQAEELLREVADRVPDRDPLLALVEVDVAQAVRLDDVELLVLALAEVRVDDDGAVVARVDQVGSYPSCFIARMTPSSCQGVVELPGKKKCQEMLTLSAVSASFAMTSW